MASQLNNYALGADLGGARRRGRRSHLGDQVVRALVWPGLRRRDHARDALHLLHGHGRVQQRAAAGRAAAVADALEDDAQVMSDGPADELWPASPKAIQDEILSINEDARHLALQAALLFTLLASVTGLANAFRMMRLPDPPIDRGRDNGACLNPSHSPHDGKDARSSAMSRAEKPLPGLYAFATIGPLPASTSQHASKSHARRVRRRSRSRP